MEISPNCCKVARVRNLPRGHRFLSRADRIPRLTILDIDVRWQCQDLRKDAKMSHLSIDVETHREPKKVSPNQWNFSEFVARFELYFRLLNEA
jgi:hypothetical protein